MQISPYAPFITGLNQVSPFTQLPQEVNLAIVSNLSQSQDFYSTMLTCKHFYQIFSDDRLWKIFYQKNYPYKTLNPTLSYQKQFQTIHRQYQNWTRGCAKLIEIHLSYSEPDFEIENSEIHVKDSKVFHMNCNKSIEVRNINNGTLEKTLEGVPGVDDVEIKSSGKFLTAWFGGFECCHDVKIWSLNDLTFLGTVKNCLRDYKIHDDLIIGKEYAMTYRHPPQLTVWNTMGVRLFSLGDAQHFEIDGELIIYADSNFLKIVSRNDYNTLKIIKISPPTCLTVTEKLILLGHENGSVSLYNKFDGSPIKRIEADIQARVLSVHAYKDLFIIRYTHMIMVWNKTSESFAYTLDRLSYPFVIEKGRLFITLANGCVEIRNIEDGHLLHSIEALEHCKSVIKLITDDDRLFVQDQKNLRIFNKDTGIHISKIDCKAYALEGCRLITSFNQKIHIRDYS